MNWRERIANYNATFPDWPEDTLWICSTGMVLGMWTMGNDYRIRSEYYGGYPPTYLKRVAALFPDRQLPLHLFSGMVGTTMRDLPGLRVDINLDTAPDFVDDAQSLLQVPVEHFDLVCADPPYSVEDCDHYQTTMVKRNLVMQALGNKLRPGAHVVWLDQVKPMYRKDQFNRVAVIGMDKSTNHRFRVINIFEKI